MPTGFEGSAASGAAGSAGSPPGVANPSAPVDEDAIAQYAHDVCGAYERCGPKLYPDLETCIAGVSCSLRSFVSGTMVTRGELLSCSHGFADIPCGTMIAQLPSACVAIATAFAGALGEESGCGGELCASGSYCNRRDEHCPRCVARAALGEPCLDTVCEIDSYCSPSTLRCEPIKTEGMPCERASECLRPALGSDAWLTCRDGVCSKPTELGGSCVQGADCVAFLRCVDGVCTERGRVGEACTGHQDCFPYSSCIRGTCTELCGFQRTGGPCFDDLLCADSYCDDATSVCVALKAAGAACTRSGECGDGLFCNAASAACDARLTDGAACSLDDECLSELCSEQRCQQPICQD